MSRPTVRVCIAICNQREFIGQCLQSDWDRRKTQINILVGDDASNDGTSEILATWAASHPEKIEHLIRKPRLGAVANMRDLISRAEGEFIARLDGDTIGCLQNGAPDRISKDAPGLRSGTYKRVPCGQQR